jgi:hypothetical protein
MNTFTKQIMTMRIIWVALLFSQFIYLFIGQTMSPAAASVQAEDVTGALKIEYVLFFMGIVVGIFSFILPTIMEKEERKAKGKLKIEGVFVRFIISLALSEAVGLFGFISKIIFLNANVFYALSAFSISLFVLRFPTEQKILAQLES